MSCHGVFSLSHWSALPPNFLVLTAGFVMHSVHGMSYFSVLLDPWKNFEHV